VAGRTIEVVKQRFDKAKEDFEATKERFTEISKDVEDLTADCDARRVKYKALRERNSRIVQKHFQNYLARKNFKGEVEFNHKKELLLMRIEPKEGDKCEDVRQLSGGERSFTTLCLLMSLGHVIESPFRVMDEYDVFLDEVSRKVTLKMLCSYATDLQQRGRQFIIITPHSLGDVRTGKGVHINKMPDPVRSKADGKNVQQTLGFEAADR
jgi:chromosome segregation ATPase